MDTAISQFGIASNCCPIIVLSLMPLTKLSKLYESSTFVILRGLKLHTFIFSGLNLLDSEAALPDRTWAREQALRAIFCTTSTLS